MSSPTMNVAKQTVLWCIYTLCFIDLLLKLDTIMSVNYLNIEICQLKSSSEKGAKMGNARNFPPRTKFWKKKKDKSIFRNKSIHVLS